MTPNNQFPFNPYEDIKSEQFNKYNKKKVAEDFVKDNLSKYEWEIYSPYNDTGIDFIAIKVVCPDGDTPIDKNLQNIKCSCDKNGIEITRFVQVKTRELKGKVVKNTFGYTLKSKDFSTDPRQVFLLYSDFTKNFIFLPLYNYLKIFYDNESLGKSHFGVPSFRKNNNKLNNLKYTNRQWYWAPQKGSGGSKISFDIFVDGKGLTIFTDSEYEKRLEYYINEIAKMKDKLFYTFSKGKSKIQEDDLRYIVDNLSKPKLSNTILNKRKITRNRLINKLNSSEYYLKLKQQLNDSYLKFYHGLALDYPEERLTEFVNMNSQLQISHKENVKSIAIAFLSQDINVYFPQDEQYNNFLIERLVCKECGEYWYNELKECYFCGELYYFLYKTKENQYISITNNETTDKTKDCLNKFCISNTNYSIKELVNKQKGVFISDSPYSLSLNHCIKCGANKNKYITARIFVFDSSSNSDIDTFISNNRIRNGDVIIIKSRHNNTILYNYLINNIKEVECTFINIQSLIMDLIDYLELNT